MFELLTNILFTKMCSFSKIHIILISEKGLGDNIFFHKVVCFHNILFYFILKKMKFKGWYYSSLEVIYIYILTPTIHECCMSSSGLNRWFLSHRKQPSKKLTNVGSLQPIATEMSFVPGQCFLPHEFATILGLLLLSDETMKYVKCHTTHIGLGFKRKQHWKGFGFGVSSLIIVKKNSIIVARNICFTKEHFFPCGILKDCIWRDTKNFHHAGQLFNLILPRK